MAYHLTTKKSSSETEHELAACFEKWGVKDYQVDYNVLRSRHAHHDLSPQERAVTVRWVHPRLGREVVLSMADQQRPQDNVRVLFLAVDTMRLNEARGIAEVMQAAYLQLDAPQPGHWTTLLELPATATREQVQNRYRILARTAHPDRGGSDEEMAALNRARDVALREVAP